MAESIRLVYLIVGVFASLNCLGQSNIIRDPTGTYQLGETVYKDGEAYGSSGTANVLLVAPGKIWISLEFIKGSPNSASGEMADSLDYKNNTAVWLDTTEGPACRLIFHFYRRSLFIEMIAEDINFACGMGHGVDPYGIYHKLKGKKPTKEEMEQLFY